MERLFIKIDMYNTLVERENNGSSKSRVNILNNYFYFIVHYVHCALHARFIYKLVQLFECLIKELLL